MSKIIVEQCLVLRMKDLNERGLLRQHPREAFSDLVIDGDENVTGRAEIEIRTDEAGDKCVIIIQHPLALHLGTLIDYRQEIKLTTTPGSKGGVQYWFVCPLTNCGRRIGVLYLPPGSFLFGCRHCYNLSYDSRNVLRDRTTWGRIFDVILRTTHLPLDEQVAQLMAVKAFRKEEVLMSIIEECHPPQVRGKAPEE